jgi:hypothetical protein
VVPANRKGCRDLVSGTILVKGLGMSHPEPEEDLDGVTIA